MKHQNQRPAASASLMNLTNAADEPPRFYEKLMNQKELETTIVPSSFLILHS